MHYTWYINIQSVEISGLIREILTHHIKSTERCSKYVLKLKEGKCDRAQTSISGHQVSRLC